MLNVAIVGCGRISKNHLSAISSNSNFKLSALCDIDKSKIDTSLAYIKENNLAIDTENVSAYANYNLLLEDARSGSISLDMIILTTPSGLHPNQAISAAESGLHVCTEKPMATRWNDGLAMVKKFDDCNKKLFVVKQNRLNSTIKLLKKKSTSFESLSLKNIPNLRGSL